MAVTEKEINELIESLSFKPLEETPWQWTQDPLESLPTVRISGGTLEPTYGAVPNVTIGTSAVGTNVGPPGMWTTTTTGTGTSYSLNQKTASGGKIHIMGEDADLVIGDKSMRTWMEKVEERLNILTPNPEMEAEWDQLRKLGERYRKLEKKCKEKSDIWNKLKAMPKPEIK